MTLELDRFLIRRAVAQDAESCYAAHRESTLVAYAHIFSSEAYPFPGEAMRERWESECAHGMVLVAELDGQVIGTAGLDGSEFVSFFLLPEYWGSGAADVLHEAVMGLARQGAADQSTLWTLRENHRARRFYEKRGWRLTGESKPSGFPPYPELVEYGIDLHTQALDVGE